MVAVTGAGSPMDDPERYLTAFHMYDYIGGRYSATSMVGGVTLAFALGYDNFVEILRGAHAADLAGEQENIRENLPLLMALLGIWNRNFLGCNTVAILPYSQALLRFPAHLQQCDMESNGKRINRLGEPVQWQTGPIVWGEPGTVEKRRNSAPPRIPNLGVGSYNTANRKQIRTNHQENLS
jgi:glucose-6-phosphate isomerase